VGFDVGSLRALPSFDMIGLMIAGSHQTDLMLSESPFTNIKYI
jgi:hypothetical protein